MNKVTISSERGIMLKVPNVDRKHEAEEHSS